MVNSYVINDENRLDFLLGEYGQYFDTVIVHYPTTKEEYKYSYREFWVEMLLSWRFNNNYARSAVFPSFVSKYNGDTIDLMCEALQKELDIEIKGVTGLISDFKSGSFKPVLE